MNLISYTTDNDLPRVMTGDKHKQWRVRTTVRAVLFNEKNQVAVIHLAANNYCGIPGGGVDDGESIETALLREVLEETGCEIKNPKEFGVTIEKRDAWKLFQISHCFTARASQVRGLSLTKGEAEAGFSLRWVESVATAIELIQNNPALDYDALHMTRRDSAILRAVKITEGLK